MENTMKRSTLQTLGLAALTFSLLPFARSVADAPATGTTSSMNASSTNKPAWQALSFVLSTDKSSYSSSEPVRLTMTVRNNTKKSQTLHFASSQSFNLVVRANQPGAENLWNYSITRLFTQRLRDVEIAPGATQVYSETWDQKGDDGQVAPRASYVIEARLTAKNHPRNATTVVNLK